MNYEAIRSELSRLVDDRQHIDLYVAYLKRLEVEKKKDRNSGTYVLVNPWFSHTKEEVFIDCFKAVKQAGLWLDGDTVLLTQRGGMVVPEYTYIAFKNLVKVRYPETKFDHGIVYEGDQFQFRKENGKVLYSHVFGDPFKPQRAILGAYAIVKNSTGEFIECLTMEDIEKCKRTATTKNIWEAWFDRMVLKTAIRRVCHVNFKDVVAAIEEEDNKNYDSDLVSVSCDLQAELNACVTIEDIVAFYNKHKTDAANMNDLVAMCSKRKQEIKAMAKTS